MCVTNVPFKPGGYLHEVFCSVLSIALVAVKAATLCALEGQKAHRTAREVHESPAKGDPPIKSREQRAMSSSRQSHGPEFLPLGERLPWPCACRAQSPSIWISASFVSWWKIRVYRGNLPCVQCGFGCYCSVLWFMV